jgi:uncharacterized membrane protein YfcA
VSVIQLLAAAPLAFLVGVSLGLLGGGGSILTVPILVYILGLDAKSAIATSLLVVGITSLTGAFRHGRHGNLDVRVGLSFGVAGIVGASGGSRVAAMDAVPGAVLLAAFAVLMVTVAVLMLRRPRPAASRAQPPRGPASPVAVAVYGLLTGLLTGLLGVGGGFIIVPTLLLVARLPMHLAIGTSLLVIALNCAAGLTGFLGKVPIHWGLALVFGVASIAGSVAGASWAARTRAERLRRGFAVFVLLAGVAMLIEQAARGFGS